MRSGLPASATPRGLSTLEVGCPEDDCGGGADKRLRKKGQVSRSLYQRGINHHQADIASLTFVSQTWLGPGSCNGFPTLSLSYLAIKRLKFLK